MTETNRIEYNRELTPELDIEKDIIAFLNYKEDDKIYLLNMSRDLFQINKLIVILNH